ncbi:MAG: restriction endonuclease subunit S [Marinobacter sp.]|uniref:restriction endonuclease subunit S n=1 Tax=Marinobacter sp. TaxID=50741 RepID=UPI003F9B9E9B
MSNTVPEGWSIHPLNGKINILSGYPFKSSLFCDDPSKMGVIRIRDLVKQSVETFYAGDFDDEYVVRSGDILIGMDGDFNIVKWKTKSALLNQRICKVKASNSGGFNSDFLFYSLVDDLDSIHAATGATTVKHLSVKDIRGIEKAYPPLPEQQKIATILSSVDDVIETTRAQTNKLKDMKTGMMQELLTKGIGPGGVPHTEFKDSPVGRIPANWKVARLDSLAKVGSSKRIRESEYVTDGVPFFRSKEVIRQSKSLDIEKPLYISKQRFTEISEKFGAPKQGDILITAVGTIGVVYLVEDREFYFKDGNLLWLRNIRPTISSQYLAKIMASEGFQVEIDRVTGGSSQAALTIEKLQELTIVVPPLVEQESIVGILMSLDEKLQATYRKLLAVTDLKKAIMQDLLTGKVRVKTDQRESAVA